MNCWIWNIDKGRRPYLREEINKGRLRQGWSYREDLDLRKIKKRIEQGDEIDEKVQRAWDRCKWMLTHIKSGDLIVVKNIPDSNSFTLVKVKGEYDFSIDEEQGDQGHIIPIEKIQSFDKRASVAPSPFVNAINREQHPIRRTKKHKETVINLAQGDISDEEATQPEKFKEILQNCRSELQEPLKKYLKDKLNSRLAEKLVLNMIAHELEEEKIEYTAGPAEQGADIIAEFDFGYVFSHKIAVQIKMHWEKDSTTHGVKQLKKAIQKYDVDAGMLVSFADELGDDLERAAEKLEAEYPVEILYGDDLYERLLETIVDPEFDISFE